jgi:hypothetical protein
MPVKFKKPLMRLLGSKCFPRNSNDEVQKLASRILKYCYTKILKSSVGPFRQVLIFGYPVAAGKGRIATGEIHANAAVYMQLRTGIVYGMFIGGDIDRGLLKIEKIAKWLGDQLCEETQFGAYELRLNALINAKNVRGLPCTLHLFRHAPVIPDDGFVSAIVNKICVAALSSIQGKYDSVRVGTLHQTIRAHYLNNLHENGALAEFKKNIDGSVIAMIDKLCVDFGPRCYQIKLYNYFAAGNDALQRNRLQAVNQLPWLMPLLAGLKLDEWKFSHLMKPGNDVENEALIDEIALINAAIDGGKPLFRSVSSALSIPCEMVRWTQYKSLPSVANFTVNEIDLMLQALSWLPVEKRPKNQVDWECFGEILSKLISLIWPFYVRMGNDSECINTSKFDVKIIENQYCGRVLKRWSKEIVQNGLIAGVAMLEEEGGQQSGISEIPDFLRCLFFSLKRFCSNQVFYYPAPLDSFRAFILEWIHAKSLAELRNISKNWHESIRHAVDESATLDPDPIKSDHADGIDTWHGVLDEPFIYGQIQLVELTNSLSLLCDGKLMEHCIGGYSENCRVGDSLIFSVRTSTGSRLSTAELYFHKFQLSVGLRSHKAKHNALPQVECEIAVAALIHALNSSIFIDRLEKRRVFQKNQRFTQTSRGGMRPPVLRRYELLTQTLAWRCAFRSEPSQEFPALARR